jgi:phytanoyl-CoA hydroxylase
VRAAPRFRAPAGGVLDTAMREAFARDGFLILEGFLPTADCDALQARAATLVAGFDPGPQRTVFSTTDQAHARDRYFAESAATIGFFFEAEATGEPVERALNKIGHALHDRDPVFDRVSRQPRVAALVQALGIARPLLLQSMYIFKQPHIGGEVDWHQDSTFLYTDPPSVIGLWFALDDATRANGCMVAMAGGHCGPLRCRFVRSGEGFTMRTLVEGDWPVAEPVALEAPRGSVVVLHGHLPHASAPNRSARPRHAYALHVVDANAAYAPDNWLQRPSLPLRGFA